MDPSGANRGLVPAKEVKQVWLLLPPEPQPSKYYAICITFAMAQFSHCPLSGSKTVQVQQSQHLLYTAHFFKMLSVPETGQTR